MRLQVLFYFHSLCALQKLFRAILASAATRLCTALFFTLAALSFGAFAGTVIVGPEVDYVVTTDHPEIAGSYGGATGKWNTYQASQVYPRNP